MNRLTTSILAAAVAVALAGCSMVTAATPAVAVASAAPAKASAQAKPAPALADAIDTFGFRLLGKLTAGTKGNVVISPLSVHAALAMTMNGAKSATYDQMASVLGVSTAPTAVIGAQPQGGDDAAYADLLGHLPNADGVKTTAANSLWAQQGVAFEKPFLAADRDFFGAQIATLNLRSPAAIATINDWVKANTGGKIDKIIDALPRVPIVLYLVNAAHFKGTWETKFEAASTAAGPFHLADGTSVDVPMMHGDVKGIETPLVQAVRLPFVQGASGAGTASMYVFVPAKGRDLSALEAALSAGTWRTWTSSISDRTAILSMPKFKTSFGADLVDPLKSLGMTDAFSNAADFSGISRDPKVQPLSIASVTHKAVIDVNENGAEAAAATVVAQRPGDAAPAPDEFVVNVDRPFLFAITDDVNGEIMFLGEVRDPRK